jgi:hypothetical protein
MTATTWLLNTRQHTAAAPSATKAVSHVGGVARIYYSMSGQRTRPELLVQGLKRRNTCVPVLGGNLDVTAITGSSMQFTAPLAEAEPASAMMDLTPTVGY